MKKALQYILLASLAVVFVAGCDHKKEDKKPVQDTPVQNTPVNFSDLSTLVGNYPSIGCDG